MTGKQSQNEKYLRLINGVKGNSTMLINFIDSMGDLSLSSVYSYANHVSVFLRHVNKNERNLNLSDFSSYMNKIKFLENGEESTPSYRITVYCALKRYSEYLYNANIIPQNYMLMVKKPKSKELIRTEKRREASYLNKKELEVYLNNVKSHKTNRKKCQSDVWSQRDTAIIYVFLNTGIRCSALKSLDIDDVDFGNHIISVTDKGGKINIHPISGDTETELRKWMKYRNKIVPESETALFVSRYRSRISQDAISAITKKYSVNIDRKTISPHKLRATYGTMLYDKTKDIYFVKQAMNHSSIETSKLYIRGKKSEIKQQASDIMEELLER